MGVKKLLVLGVAGTATAALAVGVPLASAAPAPPESLANCSGTVTVDPAPTTDDPNLLDYQFHCDTDITAYTLLINRPGHPFSGIDDLSSTANVFLSTGDQVTTEQFSCSGTLPGDGINCNAGAGGFGSAWTNIEGTVDTTDAFCAHLPPHAKPGAKAIPGAVAQLVVSDNTGAEDGPFRLYPTVACKPVKPVTTAPSKTKRARKAARRAKRLA